LLNLKILSSKAKQRKYELLLKEAEERERESDKIWDPFGTRKDTVEMKKNDIQNFDINF
jgi:hypothetical protein